jgi:2-hydroxy-6-oxonona-2,4-dienedioate hydrolase
MNEAAYRAAEARLWGSVGVEPVERMIHLDRNDVDVRVQEVGTGPPVLFIHGANTSGASWVRVAAALQGYRCLVLDRPGTGLSPTLARPVTTATLPEIGDTLVADVLDALGLPSAHVVAASYGGYLALRSAAAFPDRVDRMVHLSWPLGAPTDGLPLFLRVVSLPGMGRLLAAMPSSERSVRMIFRSLGHGPKLDDGRLTQEDIDCYMAMLRHTDTRRNEFAPARSLVSPFRGLYRLLLGDETLSRIIAPTLFIWGDHDPFGGPDVARAFVVRVPGAELDLIPGAGHTPWIDDLERCVAAVSGFLSRSRQASLDAAPDPSLGAGAVS